MRSCLLLTLIKLLGVASYTSTALFDAANSAYERGRFEEALKLYREVLNDVQVSDELKADAACNRGSVFLDVGRTNDAISSYEEAIRILPTHPDAYFNLGVLYQDRSDFTDALHSYASALKNQPAHPEAMANLGSVQHALGDYESALDSYSKAIRLIQLIEDNEVQKSMLISLHYASGSVYDRLAVVNGNSCRLGPCSELAVESYREVRSLDPTHTLAGHALSSHQGDETVATAPKEYVAQLFDDYAETFDESLRDLGYSVPSLLANTVTEHLAGRPALSGNSNAPLGVAVDAGCGTGLLAPLVRKLTTTLVGIDLSQQMIRKAEQRSLYDELVVGDVVEEIYDLIRRQQRSRRSLSSPSVDLIAAADVLVYIGDLSDFFAACDAALSESRLLAFTTERADEGATPSGWFLQKSGRFAHEKRYIESLAALHHFDVATYEEIVPRFELGRPIPGQLFVLEKRHTQHKEL